MTTQYIIQKFLLLFCVIVFTSVAYSQTFVPVNVTGFNHDLIANGAGGTNRAEATTTTTFDGFNIGGDNVMYSKDFKGNNNLNIAPPFGLPINRIIASVNLMGANYTLAHYDSLNALVLKTNGSSGTLMLETPGVFSKIAFLGSSAEGPSSFNVTLNFSDGTNTNATFTVPDWFNGSGFAIKGIGRVTRTTLGSQLPDVFFGNSENPRLYDNQITLNAPFNTKILTSINFTKTSAGGSTAILAINGITAVNAPSAPIATVATNLNFPSFTANWQASSAATAYFLDVSSSSSFSNLLPNYNNRNVGNVLSFNITGLIASQTYYYRVRASNVSGISPSSNTIAVSFPDCPPGDYEVKTQAEVDNFKVLYPNCKQISGTLNITNTGTTNDINNVDGFINIESVTNALNITHNTILNNLNGLRNLRQVGEVIWIGNNSALKKINSFAKLKSVKGFFVGDHKELDEVSGFDSISTFFYLNINNNTKLSLVNIIKSINQYEGNVIIKNNPTLVKIDAIGNPSNVNGNIIIENNASLTTLNAFSSVTSTTELIIENNANLVNLDQFSNLVLLNGSLRIVGNNKLNSINGLRNIPASNIKGSGLIIQNNPLLSICDLPNICQYLQGPGPRTISGNAVGCESEQTVKNICTGLVAPIALAANNITSTGFTANWQASSGATKYLLDVSTSSSFNTFVTGYNNLDVGNVLNRNITGLNANTIYYYRIRANNNSSTSSNSNVIQAITLAAGLSAPIALAASSITSTGFTANWQATSGATKYLLDVSTSSSFNTFVAGYNNLDVGNVLNRNITGLNVNTQYYYRIRASNSSITSSNSNVIQLTTSDISIGPKPIVVTGFNHDIIANGSGGANRAQASTTTDVGTFVLYSKDFRGNNNQNSVPVYGLPDNGKIANASLNGYDYQLENYTGNNALVLINANDSETLSLGIQDTFDMISFLAFSESGATNINVKLNFSDGTNKVESITIPDWYGQSNFAIKGIGRIARSNDVFGPGESTDDPRLYNHLITIAAPFDGKRLVSLTFTKTSATGISVILALTGLEKKSNSSCNIIIPDTAFKNYLIANKNINTNSDNEIQCAEAENFSGEINCSNLQIKDMTGLEAFVNLTSLKCNDNQIVDIDLSKNSKLQDLSCYNNQLNRLSVQLNTELIEIYCFGNKLNKLDVDNNPVLEKLGCNNNLIDYLDISKNTNLIELWVYNNKLASLNLANGINEDMALIEAYNNPELSCIKVDNENYSEANWRKDPFKFDPQHKFNENCGPCDEWREKLKSNFLINANACVDETIHLIDYSKLEIEKDVSFSWDFGNGLKSTERDPLAIYNTIGQYTISLIVSNLECKGLTIQKDISILSCLINPNTDHNLAMIYPTPNTGEPMVFAKLIEKSPIRLKIYNSSGRLMKTYFYEETELLNETIELEFPGVYWLELVHRNGIEKLKTFVIK